MNELSTSGVWTATHHRSRRSRGAPPKSPLDEDTPYADHATHPLNPIINDPGDSRPATCSVGLGPAMIRYRLRAVTHEDEDNLVDLARHLNTVNLPNDRSVVREIIDLSVRSFSRALEDPRQREYTFVIEDREEGRVVGTSKIIAQLGRREAPYIYLDVITEEKYSATI